MKIKSKILALVLCVSLFTTSLYGCGKITDDLPVSSIPVVIPTQEDINQIVDNINQDIQNNLTNGEEQNPGIEEVISLAFSDNWEDYVGDIETFVYGLLISRLELGFDVFSAYVTLDSGVDVFGIAYTDYSECFVDENEDKCVFSVGFIAGPEETPVSKNEIEKGLQVYDVENGFIDGYSYIWGYTNEKIEEHCVVYNQYLRYGVSEEGKVFYSTVPYSREVCDEALGSLYSYDEAKYLLNYEVGNYEYLNGSSLFTEMDFADIEAEINRVLEEQDLNFATVDLESYVYIAEGAITSYLLSLQEEEFLGYKTSDLIEAASQLDPLEVLRITPNDLQTINLKKCGEATAVKVLVGVCTGIVAAASIAISPALLACPPLSSLNGAIAGTAIEIFMQVVISNERLDEINWTKVAVAATTGAISGFIGPYIQVAKISAVGRFAVDSSLDGLLGALENTVYGFMDGKEGMDLVKSFGFGFALAFAMSAGVKGIFIGAEKLANKLGPKLARFSEDVAPKLTKKVATLMNSAGSGYVNLLNNTKHAVDSTVFHSKLIEEKMLQKQVLLLLNDGNAELADKAWRELEKNSFDFMDPSGQKISFNDIKLKFNDADNNALLAMIKVDDDIVEIRKVNNVIGVFFDKSKYLTVEIPEGLNADYVIKSDGKKEWLRDDNFTNAAREIRTKWIKDPSLVPDSIAQTIADMDLTVKTLTDDKLVDIIKYKSEYVMHENIDMKTVTLVTRKVHNFAQGGVFHMGGFAIAKYFKQHMGKEYFERIVYFLSSQAATAIQ